MSDRERWNRLNQTRKKRYNLFTLTDDLRAIRRYRGIKQKDLAKEIGVSSTTICNWEKGREFANYENLVKWFNALDVRVVPNDL